jgi:hypothetical protein
MSDTKSKYLSNESYEVWLTVLSNKFAGDHETTKKIALDTLGNISEISFNSKSRVTWDSILSNVQIKEKLDLLLTNAIREVGGSSIELEGLKSNMVFLEPVNLNSDSKTITANGFTDILILYAPEDLEAGTEIRKQLNIFKLTGQARLLDFNDIKSGNREEEEQKMLQDADIVLPVISSSFFITNYLVYVDAHVQAGKRMVPVLVKNCLWQRIKLLARFVTVPKDGRFIYEYDPKDEGYVQVAEAIDAILNSLQK